MAEIAFPRSSMPGQKPGDGIGRLINCYCEVDGTQISWVVMPGLINFGDVQFSGPRGAIVVGPLIYAAYQDHVVTISANGAVAIVGALSGSNPVTWALNNKRPTPDLVVVSVPEAGGMFGLSPGMVGVLLPSRYK